MKIAELMKGKSYSIRTKMNDPGYPFDRNNQKVRNEIQ